MSNVVNGGDQMGNGEAGDNVQLDRNTPPPNDVVQKIPLPRGDQLGDNRPHQVEVRHISEEQRLWSPVDCANSIIPKLLVIGDILLKKKKRLIHTIM